MKRSVIYNLNTATLTLIVFGILAVVNFIGFRHHIRFDFTKQKSFSLAPQSIKVVKTLKDEVRVIGFYEAKEKSMFDNLLDRYKYHSKKLAVQFYDPDKDKVIAEKYKIKQYRTVVIEKGKRETRLEDITDENGEEKITNAIIKLEREATPHVCFLKGHGEKEIADREREGYSVAQDELKDEGYDVKNFSLLESGKMADCSVLVIAGPQKPFLPKEIELISDYFKKGGRGMILLDPADRETGLETFLSKIGIVALNETVIDPISTIFGQSAATPVVSEYTSHEVVRDLKEASFYPLTRPFKIQTELPNKNIKVEAIAKTTPNSWGEVGPLKQGKVKYDAGKDRKGPLNLAVAASGKWSGRKDEKEMRLVAVGDSDFSNNRSFEFSGNGNFFLNAVAWLVGDESLISIRPTKAAGISGRLMMTPRQVQLLFLLTIVVTPLVIIGSGIIVWLRRRRLA